MAKMVKIVGKIFIICCIAQIATFLDASIGLEVRSDSTIPNQVIIGQPFFLDITIKDITGTIPNFTIQGIEKFNAKQTGSFRSTLNGKVTARYSYQLRINKVGTYTIGPATLDYQNQHITSNTVPVTVVQDMHVSSQQNNAHQAEYKAFLRLIIDETSVVIGQAIHCTLRFYYQDPSLSLNNVTMPELPAFEIKEVENFKQVSPIIMVSPIAMLNGNGICSHYKQVSSLFLLITLIMKFLLKIIV